MAKKATLIAVHGTYNFWNKGDWAKEGSPLHNQLKKKFGNNLEIKIFPWPSWNRHYTRVEASVKLRELILECSKANPGGPLFLVGHSHGGNVSFYALRDPKIAAKVSGLVCLSTPFLCAMERAQGRTGLKLLPWVLFAALLFLAYQFGYKNSPWTGEPWNDFGLAFLGMGLSVLAVKLLMGWALRLITPGLTNGGKNMDTYTAIQESFKLGGLPKEKVLLIRTAGDEASIGLGIPSVLGLILKLPLLLFKALNRLAHGAVTGIGAFVRMLPKDTNDMWLLMGVLTLLTQAALWIIYDVRTDGIERFVLQAILFVVTAVLSVIAYVFSSGMALFLRGLTNLLLAPLFLVTSLPMFFYGFDTMFYSFLVEISAESVPPGDWELSQLSLEKKEGGLWHSSTHSDPMAAAKIVEWISGKTSA